MSELFILFRLYVKKVFKKVINKSISICNHAGTII